MCVAITAPMLLTVQALSAAYYARDEITAYHLAQEGIEAVHAVRDGQILEIALTSSSEAGGLDLFGDLNTFANNTPFTIDVTLNMGDVQACSGDCPPLRTNGVLYGYDSAWETTNFTRTMHICYIQDNGDCDGTDETNAVRVTSTVTWRTASYQERTFTISEDLYRWVQDGSGV